MKKFYVTVNGNKYEVEVEELTEDCKEFCNVIKDNKEESNNNVVKEGNNSQQIKTTKPIEVKGEKIESPMPGNILSVNISKGDKISKGQIMFILEAMKMENEIMAPRDGKVVSVHVNKGGKVDTGDLLVVIE